MQLTLGLLFTQGINMDSVLCVYTIASVCQASCLQEMEFSLKAFIYLPDRNAATSASAVLCGHNEDMVCSCTLKTRGKTSAEQQRVHMGRSHVKILWGKLRAAMKAGLGTCQQSSSEVSGNFKTQTFIMSTTFCKYLAPDKKDWKLHMPNFWDTSRFVLMWTFFWNKIAFILEWNVYTGIYSCHGSCVNKP